jgi:hypothetical protein
MSSLLDWLKVVPTSLAGSASFAGTAYEPWVQRLQFLLVVVVLVSAIAWLLTRRHLVALAHQLLSLLKRSDEAFVRACQYPPEVERRLQPSARYAKLVESVCGRAWRPVRYSYLLFCS